MEKIIIIEGRAIRAELVRKNVRNLNLRMRSDGSIYVSAPRGLPCSRIEEFIQANSSLITAFLGKRLARLAAAPMPQNFETGERLCFHGKIYTLVLAPSDKNRAELKDRELILHLRKPDDPRLTEELFEGWMRDETRILMENICSVLWESFSPPLKEAPEIKFRRMRSRWGSCCPEKRLVTFNSRLAALPAGCAEYVAVHEFCHFIHPDHSRDFYSLLGSLMPDFREREKVLSDYALVPL